MSPCRDVPQPEYTPSLSTTWPASAGGDASAGDATAVAGVGAGAGIGVAGAGVGIGVAGAGALGVADGAATVDSARTDAADVSVLCLRRAGSVTARRFGVALESGADGTAAANVCGRTAISPVGAAGGGREGRRASVSAMRSAAPRVRAYPAA
jgi:hypothetical protein